MLKITRDWDSPIRILGSSIHLLSCCLVLLLHLLQSEATKKKVS